MKKLSGQNLMRLFIVIGAVWSAPQTAVAEEQQDVGALLYRLACAACHGESGQGDGGMRDSLKVPPSDLTLLAQQNGGVFPTQEVVQFVDGRQDLAAHGSREMPIWGKLFETPESIQQIVAYVQTLQKLE